MTAFFVNQNGSPYRADLDGLRAIAVLGVVLFHAGVQWLPGGFVGVDVFFVISGYLITGILLREMDAETYSITNFYLRRARRILPALIFVLLTTGAISWFVLLPLEMKQLARHTIGALLFASNIIFWRESGYFDTIAEFKPLLHTWSLAVEEQFYIFWPLLLMLIARKKQTLKVVFLTLLIASFITSTLLVVYKPVSAFFLIPSRTWEFMVGSALVIYPNIGSRKASLNDAFSSIGLLLIGGSYLFLDKSSPFPAWNAFWPCFGTALIVNAGPHARPNRILLQNPALVFIGLISYSLYLWHWPLLTFLRIQNLGALPATEAALAVSMALVLAVISWRFIERPFRHRNNTPNPQGALSAYVACLFALAGVATLIKYNDGFPERLRSDIVSAQASAYDVNPARGNCHADMDTISIPDATKCTTGEHSQTRVVVWGDSHAEALLPGLASSPAFYGQGIRQITKTSCPPLQDVDIVRAGVTYTACTTFNSSVLNILGNTNEITTVVMSARWPVYVHESGYGLPEQVTSAPKHALANKDGQSGLHAFEAGLERTVSYLSALGKRVVIVGTIPEMPTHVPTCVARMRATSHSDAKCVTEWKDLILRQKDVDETIDRVVSRVNSSKISAVFPVSVLCQAGRCRVTDDAGRVLYYDHNHLSVSGAHFLSNSLFSAE